MLSTVNSFARLASDRSEVVGASLVLLMITMMVVPLSPAMLDVLIALNICATVILVISAVLLDTPLSFSSFPAILLMTTLFRLSLTISTTRQILLEADAGEIIQTFGEFVVGGNVAVGLVIFLIVSVVNFLVVTKGSERVAEVAARFSLDSMPGKQMSIDGDLRNGSLTQEQAKAKRSDLEKESQLFGAMDGAIKFVKNDAIAGLVITVINLVGGLTVGMLQHEMTFGQAGNIYTILSVGDGLVAIIPSLMTSVAAGLIVTRVTKGEADGANTAQDMIRQLVSNPKALQISGLFCLVFAAVPGMPAPVFVLAGGALLFKSFTNLKPVDDEPEDPKDQFTKMLQDIEEKKGNKVIEDVMNSTTFAPLEIRYPSTMEPTAKSMLFSIAKFTRNQLIQHSGLVYPVFQFTDGEKISDVQLLVHGVPMLNLKMSDKRLQVFCTKEQLGQIQGLVTLEFDKHLGRYTYYSEPVNKQALDAANVEYVTFEKRWAKMIEVLLISKSKDFFTLNEAQKHFTTLNDSCGELVKEMLRVLPASKAAEVFQKLLCENISIRNANLILANLVEWGQRERDPLIICEQVRRALSEQISHQNASDGVLNVLTLDSEFEQLIRESLRSDGNATFVDLDADSANKLLEMVTVQFKPWAHLEVLPVVICSIDVRPHFRDLTRSKLAAIQVMSFQEVSPTREIQLLDTIRFDESLIDEQKDTNAVEK